MSNDKSIKTASGYEIKLNSGNLFKNDSDNPNAPLYTGTMNIDGAEWRLALWKNEKYLSCKFSQDNHVGGQDFNNQPKKISKPKAEVSNEFNDDIPF